MARPLAAAGVFPARTIHLLQLGEEAAQLATMALNAADIHDEQARLMMQRLVALAVPSITIAGVREPICADCVAWVNPIRVQNGLDPIHVLPGAYEPAEDTKIYWEFD